MDSLADITLNDETFFLVPGGYTRSAENPVPAKPGRLILSRFEGGLGVAYDHSPGEASAAGWSGSTVHSINDGTGLEPWPYLTAYSDPGLLDVPSTGARIGAVTAGSNVYLHVGTRLYRTPAVSASSWASLATAHSAGTTIYDIGFYRDDVMTALGAGVDINRHYTSTSANAIWRSGYRGHVLQGYQAQMIFSHLSANVQEEVYIGTTGTDGAAALDFRSADAPILRMGLFAGACVVATRNSLFLLKGQAQRVAGLGAAMWEGELEPLFSHGYGVNPLAGDFSFLQSLNGKLYTWLGGGVMEYDPGASSGDGWRRVGPSGLVCRGACVTLNHLVVALETSDNRAQLWIFDGLGWWLILDAAAPGAIWPCALSGAGGFDLIVFSHGSTTYRLGRLQARSVSSHSYSGSASWTSPLLTAGNLDTTKAWRQVAANFSAPAVPGNPSSSDSVTVALDYSLNAGETWVEAASVSTTIDRETEVSHVFATPPITRLMQLRVRWSSVADWAPVLTSLVVDYATIDTAPRRQQWKLEVAVPDQLTGSGRAIIEDLWDAWRVGANVAFRDIDYGAVPVERSVRILDIAESAPQAGTDDQWSGGVVTMTLSEV